MKIIIKTKNFELTGFLERFINDKIGKLEKFAKTLGKDSMEIFVEVEKETNHHRKGDLFIAHLQIQLPGKNLMAKAHGEDLQKAIIDAKDELEIEIKKHKLKVIELPRRKIRKEMGKEIF
ncbi:MAG: ribosomal subunit interface protein [Candidatus Staskawiczbacteria bacterium RIFCSPHIGHO2_02_FULL_43_16]|uniref:Ribosomal subunit interface protein n=1 Tax=Candidatus Staskawiczbacteria bacterium RIFCSPHIGHO2_01_FULL_41_41 TaxID=1802203 RepID=A0A1G2HSG0_9BACT|nr:MAG: ribosomal subunit interface protein [Candidatus Staskawiczbacteria bacterium RIFCSPHIGHO2_01_FULL_41_41]OGZ67989.1 MAG: ribosomal subunit interface protein [Candidatus Staskawiczbacteria bacterium RIFCSPHIGHO2_02_FULL_43_16]OGZ74554.1 MAG: ribosomal subunit interface protein [Candidatus Staskawiczbacteria bacterium RIFCSPLOWO2_01_FULL_43_17b]